MKKINDYILESKLEDEMKEWEKRFKEPFGKALKELQYLINDLGLYNPQKNEYGFYMFTPFDSFVTAYALDGNKKFTFEHIKRICDNYEFSEHEKIKKLLDKISKLV